MKVQQVRRTRSKQHSDQQLPENGRNAETAEHGAGNLGRGQQDRDQQRELKCWLHSLLRVCGDDGVAGLPVEQTTEQRKR